MFKRLLCPEALAACLGPGQAPAKPSEARPLAPPSLQPSPAAPFLCHHMGLGHPQRTPLTSPASSFQVQLRRRALPHTLPAPRMVRAHPLCLCPHSACGAPSKGPGLTGGVQAVPRVWGDCMRALGPPEPHLGPDHTQCPAPPAASPPGDADPALLTALSRLAPSPPHPLPLHPSFCL